MQNRSWLASPNQIRLMSETGRQKLANLHRQYRSEVELQPERIHEALPPAVQPATHVAVAELVAACTPEQSDVVRAYLSDVLAQRTASATKAIARPSIFGNGAKRPLEPEARALRDAFARLAGLEALRMALETGSLSPWKNVKSLSIANLAALDIGLKAHAPCPVCAAVGIYQLRTMDTSKSDQPFRGRFDCGSCGHAQVAADMRSSPPSCTCAFCTALNNRLTSDLRQLFADESPRAMAAYELELERLKKHKKPAPDHESMRRDWVLHKNDSNKALRALIELKPKDGDDFLKCLKMYLGRHAGSMKEILGLAERHKLIYQVIEQWLPECRSYEQMLMAAPCPVWSPDAERWLSNDDQAQQVLGTAAAWLCNTGPQAPSACSLEVSEQAITLVVKSGRVQLYDDDSGWMSESLRPRTRSHLVLNPHFQQRDTHQVPAASTARVFRSHTECNAFHRIRAELPNAIVIPNYPMHRLVDLRALKPHFSSEDWTYLQNCELDIVVCNDAGYVTFVEEVQRGDHHNTPEWSRKDALKRQALQLAGIQLRESF